ncbi:MAG: hypothetical protein H6767_09525 [Candidatus Peribacteria bacterium]|nr:MAG: hypothetical protein H6767_09525 [Candidatus Peribacteria bacterium]
MSNSPKKDEFQQYLETTIEQDFSIDHLTILEYFQLVGAQESFILYLK